MDDSGRPGRSGTVDLDGPVHHVDYGGAADGPDLVLVHGLGGSHLNWDLLAPLLTPHARVRALDLPGFGLSEPERRTASVPENVAVLARYLTEVVGRPAVLVGNSMGGMISLLAAARVPQRVRGLVLVDPAVPGPVRRPDPRVVLSFAAYALPGVGERVVAGRRQRTGVRASVLEALELCGVAPDRLPADLLERSVALVERRQDAAAMDRAFLAAARSLLRLLADPRPLRRAMASVDVPVLLAHGDRDRLVPVSVARAAARRHPGWRYEELPGAGHMPQLQVPEELAAVVLDWLRATAGTPSPA